MIRAGRPAQRGERGAVAIVVALSSVMLFVTLAIVLNFSVVRLDRQVNKLAADNAAMAGIQASDLSGSDNIHTFRGACAALSFLTRNHPKLSSLSGTWTRGNGGSVGSSPCNSTSPEYARVCVANDPTSWAVFNGTLNGITVTIKSGYLTSDGGWSDETLTTNDTGSVANGGCDNLAVMLRQSRDPGLAGFVGHQPLVTNIRSVGRILPPGPPEAPVALLLLERRKCQVLTNSGTNTAILVNAFGNYPGRIHSDSLGNGADCGTGSQVLDGNSNNGIVAKKTATSPSIPGQIEEYALSGVAGAQAAKAYDAPPFVISEGQPSNLPVSGKLLTRAPVDKEYRLGVRDTISAARQAWASSPQPGDKVVNNCTNASNATVTAALSHTGTVYFNCTNPISYGGTVSFAASKVIINTAVNLNGTSDLAFPNAKEVYIRGSASPSIGLDLGGNKFRVNNAGVPVTGTCPTSAGRTPAKLVVGTGTLHESNGGLLQLCNTSVIMMGDGASGSGCVPASNGTNPVDPTTACDSGYLATQGGNMEWTAPNLTSGQATVANWRNDLEDLALWSEAAGNNSGLGGGANVHLAGVFMVPNSDWFSLKGGGSTGAMNVENSQFVARRLLVTGGSTITLAPSPFDSVPVANAQPYTLAR